MGILTGSQFDVNAALPLDSRDIVTNLAARDAIASGRRYDGMKVYVVASQTNWQLQGGIANINWVELTAGSSGSTVDLSQYISKDVYGNLDITLRAQVTSLVLVDESAVLWKVTCTDNGELQIDDAVTGLSVTEVIINRDDSVQVALKVLTNVVVSDSTLGIGELIANLYLVSPNGMAWKVKALSDGTVYLESGSGNRFALKDQLNNTLFKVAQGVDGTMLESKPFTGALPTPTPSGNNVPFTFHIVNGLPVLKIWNGTTWISYENPVVKDTLPLGTVIDSCLTPTEFLAEMNDPTGARWKLVDGSSIVGSDLAKLRGWTNLPFGKGLFKRSIDETATNDPDLLERSKMTPQGSDYLGSYQVDDVGPHTHSFDFGIWRNDSGSYHARSNYAGHIGRVSDNFGSPQGIEMQMYIDKSTGTESRPKNFAVNFFIKYNR